MFRLITGKIVFVRTHSSLSEVLPANEHRAPSRPPMTMHEALRATIKAAAIKAAINYFKHCEIVYITPIIVWGYKL